MNKIVHPSIVVCVFLAMVACAPNGFVAPPTLSPPSAPLFTPPLAPTVTPTRAPTTAPTFTPTVLPPPTSTATPTITPPSGEFDANRALEHARVFAVTIGARVAGTENATRAGDYIAQQFASYGYPIEKQAFTFESWEDRGTRVQITAPETRALDARPLRFSAAGDVEAELAAVDGIGEESDFIRKNVRGQIALVRRGGILFSDVARNAERAGAVATIIYNNAPERFAGTLRDQTANPVLGISGRDGQTLVDWLSKGAVKIKIESDTLIAQKTGRNMIATKRGASGNVIVLGAHYDSVEVGAGANDNASG
ncbi:MAG: PA domain-containing protein, partial [Chloroflexota bacterium]